MTAQHYDVIIIGTGAGGGTLAHRLAPTGNTNSSRRGYRWYKTLVGFW